MMRTTYGPGTWPVIVLPGVVVALPPETPADVVARMWERMPGEPTLRTVIDVLAAPGGSTLDALPSFAAVLAEGGDVRVVLRGDVTARAEAPSGVLELSGADVTTWSERFVAGATRVEVSLASPGGADLPVVGGVVFAASVTAELSVDAPTVTADVVPPVIADPLEAEEAQAEEPQVRDSVTSETATGGPETEEPHADGPADDGPATHEQKTDEPDAEAAAPLDSIPFPPSGELTLAPPPEEWEATVHSAPAAATGAAGAEPPSAEGDHDGSTVSVAELRRLRGQTADGLPGVAAASGRVRVSTGQVVALDRTVVIGRRPRSPRAGGSNLPHLIAVDSPEQDISRSHLEIRPEGDTVVVIDLHTTNGSTLLRTGSDPMRLHPGEPTLVVSGDVVDLGDGVRVTFEGLP